MSCDWKCLTKHQEHQGQKHRESAAQPRKGKTTAGQGQPGDEGEAPPLGNDKTQALTEETQGH